MVGTPYWMAPEILHGKEYDEKADSYSYGIVLCEIISRKDADPDIMPRNNVREREGEVLVILLLLLLCFLSQNFSLDETAFREMPEVISSPCPPAFIDLACNCSKVR